MTSSVQAIAAFILWLSFACGRVHAVGLEFDHEFESPDVEAAVRHWSDNALAALPPSMHERFPGTVRVRFRYWGKNEQLTVPYCSGDAPDNELTAKSAFENYGRYNALRNIIYLNSKLIDEILLGVDGGRSFDCYHGNFYRLATATLLHEIGHAYDALDLDEVVGKSKVRSGKSRSTVSTDPSWTVVNGSHTRLFGFRNPTNRNRDIDRLPSAHAAKNKSELFAVHFEYFLLDSDYACRFPTHHEYFESHFGWAPARSECLPSFDVASHHNGGFANLDPRRIYQVRYLMAAPGQAAESRLGHSMLHFVVCARGTPVGPDCLAQEEEHIVLGFAARTDDSLLRPIKGIVGSYDSMVFFTSLNHQLQVYNLFEFRDVVSHPIGLTRDQIERLTLRSIELYWTYRGPYRIFSINCATETEDLLKAAILDEDYIHDHHRTPKGVLKGLVETGRGAPGEPPIVYTSDFEFSAQAFSTIYNVPPPSSSKSLLRHVDRLNAHQRREALARIESDVVRLQRSKETFAGDSLDDAMFDTIRIGEQLEFFRFLESIITRSQNEKLAAVSLGAFKKAARRDPDKAALLERFQSLALIKEAGDRDGPGGYGIPLHREIDTDFLELGDGLMAASAKIFASISGDTRVLELQSQKQQTEELSRSRYNLLRTYAAVARAVRTDVILYALNRFPDHSNAMIRSMLEDRFGQGSFEPTRISDARIDRLRQENGLLARTADISQLPF